MYVCIYRSSQGYYAEALRIFELLYGEDSPHLIQVCVTLYSGRSA